MYLFFVQYLCDQVCWALIDVYFFHSTLFSFSRQWIRHHFYYFPSCQLKTENLPGFGTLISFLAYLLGSSVLMTDPDPEWSSEPPDHSTIPCYPLLAWVTSNNSQHEPSERYGLWGTSSCRRCDLRFNPKDLVRAFVEDGHGGWW